MTQSLGAFLLLPAIAWYLPALNHETRENLTILRVSIPAMSVEYRVVPPARFDFPGSDVQVVEVPAARMQALCRKNAPWAHVGACTVQGSPCIIIWPKGRPRSGLLWRHENAHCNGWPLSHPN